MEKPAVIWDIDGTMTDKMSFIQMAWDHAVHGLFDRSQAEFIAQAYESYALGSSSYEDAVTSMLTIYAAGLNGRPVDEVADATNRFFDEYDGFYGYVQPTTQLLSETCKQVIVTGNTQDAADAVAKRFGIPNARGTVLGTTSGANGRKWFNGSIKTSLATQEGKRTAVQDWLHRCRRLGSFAFGDSIGDFKNLNAVENRICIAPSPELRIVAELLDWDIVDDPAELQASRPLLVVEQKLQRYRNTLLLPKQGVDNEYFQSQYTDGRKVSARFAMYSLEICEAGEQPFNPDFEVIKAIRHMNVQQNAFLVDMGTSTGHFLHLLRYYGYENVVGFDVNPGQFYDGQRRASNRREILEELFPFIPPRPESNNAVLEDENLTASQARERRKKLVVVANANNVPVRKGAAQVYVANNMLYHLKDIPGAIKQAKESLEPKKGIFISSTSGAENKLEQREDEEEINRILNKRIAGRNGKSAPKMNDRWTTEKAMLELPKHFEFVYVLNHNGELLVQDEASKDMYRQSLYSMYDQYDPIPDWNDFADAVEEIIAKIPAEGKRIKVSRSVFICSGSDVDPGDEYKRVPYEVET
jgi:phosphoserine phosphatase/SAM-dependent methyltransferase